MTSRRSILASSSTRCLARTRSLGVPGGQRVTQQEIPLIGGNTSTVVRVGDTVRRNVGPWTPAVHALLRHLEYIGFTGAPRVLGFDERGREVLSYLEGECGSYPLGPDWVTDDALVAVATMLRMYHDAQFGFRPPPGAVGRSFGPPPRADLGAHLGHQADGGGRRPGLRADRAHRASAPAGTGSAAHRLRAAHPGVRAPINAGGSAG